jgi:hypothetical protein
MNNSCICWFFTHILLRILIFKGLTARRLYKSFGVKGLTTLLQGRGFATKGGERFGKNAEMKVVAGYERSDFAPTVTGSYHKIFQYWYLKPGLKRCVPGHSLQ